MKCPVTYGFHWLEVEVTGFSNPQPPVLSKCDLIPRRQEKMLCSGHSLSPSTVIIPIGGFQIWAQPDRFRGLLEQCRFPSDNL